MYPVSNAFHTAIRNGAKQKALLIFDNAVFSDVDINIDRGITFHDRFNMKDSLCIGQTPSNEISFSLFNDYRYLNSYEFGDFLATIGVKIGESNYWASGNVFMRTLNDYIGYSSIPYLTRNGTTLNTGFRVNALLGYNGLVWAFSENGGYAVYRDMDGADVTASNPVNMFMRTKAKGWSGKGIYYNNRNLFIYDNAEKIREQYEFCPLGHFIAERPNAPDQILINMVCYDLMQRFESDMPSASELGITYPISLKNLLTKLCNYVSIPLKTTNFINDSLTVASEPQAFENATMRNVIGWIAEAAASNARIDRDGYLILDWVRATTQSINENNYSVFEPFWYTTKKVTKLYNRDTSESEETTVGSGNEYYLIQDNPFLAGA